MMQQLSMTDEFKGVTTTTPTTSTYSSWSLEMEALLRAKGFSVSPIQLGKKISRGSFTAKNVWEKLNDHLKGQASHTKIHLRPFSTLVS